MANKVKENNTLYIRRCKHCKSLFSYTNLEWAKDDWHSDKGIIKCPYCESKNKIRFKIRYKSLKKMDKDYKAELEQVQEANRLTNIKLKDLESEYSKFKCEVGKYTTYKKDYEDEKKKCIKLNNDLFEVRVKVDKINTYIDNYMNSPKKNNLATKYIKEIEKISKS